MALPPRAPKSAQIDDSLDDGFMSGTFRWARGKKPGSMHRKRRSGKCR